MKKHLKNLIIFCILSAFFIIPSLALAEKSQSVSIPNPLCNDRPDCTLWDIVGGIINFLFIVAIFAAVFTIIYAAYLFLFSAGDPEKVKTARRIIIYAIIGVIVVFLSKSIINLLLMVIGSKTQIK